MTIRIYKFKMIEMILNVLHCYVHKNMAKDSDGLHNHSTVLTMIQTS